jgi:hypothetical protein
LGGERGKTEDRERRRRERGILFIEIVAYYNKFVNRS